MAVLQTFFRGPGLGVCERACAASFPAHGHSLRLYAYEPLEVPPGVELADAAAIIPLAERDAFFAAAPGRVSQFSNGFRYRLLKEHGGWWVDTDVMCLSKDLPDSEIVLGSEHDGEIVGTAILRFPPGHPLLVEADRFWRKSWGVDTWAHTGPQLMSRLAKEFDLTARLAPQRELYPVTWSRVLQLFDPICRAEIARAVEGRPFLHIWLSMLPRYQLPRETVPPTGSYLRDQVDRYFSAEASLHEGKFISGMIASLAEFGRATGEAERVAEHARKVTDLAIADVALSRAHGERLTTELDETRAWLNRISAELERSNEERERLDAYCIRLRTECDRLEAVCHSLKTSLPFRLARRLGLGRLTSDIRDTPAG